MSGVGVSTISPPELKTVRGDDIVTFDISYERYVRQIQEVNLNRSTAQRIAPAGFKACVSAELLRSLVAIKTFDGCEDVASVTDENVKESVKSRTRCTVDDISSHVRDALSRVRFKPGRSDPQGATLQFFADAMTKLRCNRVDQAISESGKAVITQLIPKLEPSIVRETVQSGHEFWPKDKRYDFQFFMQKVSTISEESAKYSRKRGNDDHGNRLPSPSSNHKKKKVASFRRESTSTGKKCDDPEPSKSGKKLKKAFKWTEPCLNDECDGIHPVKDCKDTSDEKKKSLLKKYLEDKEKKRKAALASLKHTEVNDGRWSLLLQDKYECVALGGNGADYSAIPRSIFDELTNSGLSFSTVPLNPPLQLDTTIKLPGSSPIIASSKVQLSVTLYLPCGPLRLRRVDFVVVYQEMHEVLLGRPLLQCLGFDLETHLEQVRSKFDNVDVSDLMAKGTKSSNTRTLSTLSTYGGLWYNRTEDDPSPPPESVGASIGADDETEVQDALNLAVEQAKNNGMLIEDLKGMIVEFRDIFR